MDAMNYQEITRSTIAMFERQDRERTERHAQAEAERRQEEAARVRREQESLRQAAEAFGS